MTQEEFTKRIYEIIKDKVFFSNFSEEIAEVVEKLPAEIVPDKVLFDGLNLFDGIESVEDDIQKMCSFTKDGDIVNLEDYYTDNGAFEDDGWDRFLAALECLMTLDEFIQYADTAGDETDLPKKPEDYNELAMYPIDENGHAEIPSGTIRIKGEAFKNCSKLVSVTIPGSVREIRGFAFGGCTNLASIEIPSAVRLIEPYAFVGCESLASVLISSSGGLLIEERAFAGCVSLTNVCFKNNPLKIIAKNAGGAMRDGLTLLDRAIAYCGEHIDEKSVGEMLGPFSAASPVPKTVDHTSESSVGLKRASIWPLPGVL